MIKKAAKLATYIAIGTTIGACILPRILFRELFDDVWPPLWKEAILYLATGYIAAFSVLLLIYRIKAALHKGKASSSRSGQTKGAETRALFVSNLPANVDWAQVNTFLRTTKFYKELLLDDWRKSDAFTACPVSDASIDCLRCLHEDLANCYQGAFAFFEDGTENRSEEYRLLREHLHQKYDRIDADLLDKIYLQYLQDDCW